MALVGTWKHSIFCFLNERFCIFNTNMCLAVLNVSKIYVGCDEAYRLNPSGNINIPVEATDLFCSGACLTEAQQVLNCIDDVLSNFIFYNKATVQQMRYALNAGCSFSRQRGQDTSYFPFSTHLNISFNFSFYFLFSSECCYLNKM